MAFIIYVERNYSNKKFVFYKNIPNFAYFKNNAIRNRDKIVSFNVERARWCVMRKISLTEARIILVSNPSVTPVDSGHPTNIPLFLSTRHR